MKYSLLLKEIRQFQLHGFSNNHESDDFNMVMRENKSIFITTHGSQTLETIIKLLEKELKAKTSLSPKRLEKYFIDYFFKIFLNSKISDAAIVKKIDALLAKMQALIKTKFTIAIPISGLSVKKEFKVYNYTIISKAKFKNLYKASFRHDDLTDELKKLEDYGDSVALIEDYGEKESLKEKHFLELDQALNIIRLYIPFFWHHVYEVQISVTNKRVFMHRSCYIFNKMELSGIHRAVASRQHQFDVDKKREPKDKYTIRTRINKLNFQKLNSILLQDNKISVRLFNSLKWAGLYSKEKDKTLKFLFLIFCLESILSNEQNNYSSITAAVSEKVAFLINKNDKNRKQTFDLLKELYTKRSSIVHGSSNIVTDTDLFNLYVIVINVYFNLSSIITKYKMDNISSLDEYLMSIKFK